MEWLRVSQHSKDIWAGGESINRYRLTPGGMIPYKRKVYVKDQKAGGRVFL
jgi:hypothetical protein